MTEFMRRTWAEVSLDAICDNYQTIRGRLSAGQRMMAVVKADAYGHGAVPVARFLRELGAEYLAVTALDEAVRLRDAGITAPILVLGYTDPAFAPTLAQYNLTQTVYDEELAYALSDACAGLRQGLLVHLKVDTGMSRLGFRWRGEEGAARWLRVLRLPRLRFEGMFTHLASSEMPNDIETLAQIDAFAQARRCLEQAGVHFDIYHCANSGGVIQYPEAFFDMVRIGIVLYGLTPGGGSIAGFPLVPAMRLCSVVAQVKQLEAGDTVSYGRTFCVTRPTRAAVVAAGYADGYPRLLSGKASVLIRGRRAPILGRVCMDMFVVDVTDIPQARAGDEVVLFGAQGDLLLSLDELAAKADTISYECVCAIGKRVPRVYIQGGRAGIF